MSPPTIILCRHGRPELSRNVKLSWREYEDWWRRYDESGLRAGQTVPDAVARFASRADVVVSSPLPRAVETARMATGGEPDLVVPEVVEAPLPPPKFPGLRLRPIMWGTLSRIAWLAGYCRDCESAREAGRRAEGAASQLEDLAGHDRTVFVTAHGWFNRMVGRRLRHRGWRLVEDHGDRYWAYRRYEKV